MVVEIAFAAGCGTLHLLALLAPLLHRIVDPRH